MLINSLMTVWREARKKKKKKKRRKREEEGKEKSETPEKEIEANPTETISSRVTIFLFCNNFIHSSIYRTLSLFLHLSRCSRVSVFSEYLSVVPSATVLQSETKKKNRRELATIIGRHDRWEFVIHSFIIQGYIHKRRSLVDGPVWGLALYYASASWNGYWLAGYMAY